MGFADLENNFPLLVALIFVAELCVVTLGTIRIIFIARGQKVLAPLLGFFEITIWLFAITQVMQNIHHVSCFAAFAGGFTIGNWVGILIERKLALGNVLVRIITHRDATTLIETLRENNYGVTCFDGEGSTGPVRLIFTIIKRKDVDRVVALVQEFNPKAFLSIEDLATAAEGIFPASQLGRGLVPTPLRLMRIGK